MKTRKIPSYLRSLIVLVIIAFRAASFAQEPIPGDTVTFKYPHSSAAQAGLGVTVTGGEKADTEARDVLVAPTAQFGYHGVHSASGKIEEIEADVRVGVVTDRFELDPRVGAAFHLDSSMLINEVINGGCFPGGGLAGQADVLVHSDPAASGLDGSAEGAIGGVFGLGCQDPTRLLRITAEILSGFRAEGRQGGMTEDVEFISKLNVLLATQGESLGGMATGEAQLAYRLSGEREISVGGSLELITRLSDIPVFRNAGIGVEGRWIQITPSDLAEREVGAERTGWYVGTTIKGAFKGL